MTNFDPLIANARCRSKCPESTCAPFFRSLRHPITDSPPPPTARPPPTWLGPGTGEFSPRIQEFTLAGKPKRLTHACRKDTLFEHLLKLGIQPVIPSNDNEVPDARGIEFDRDAYRDRNILERLIGWLKESRRIFSRFEKTAKNFGGVLKIAFIRRYLTILYHVFWETNLVLLSHIHSSTLTRMALPVKTSVMPDIEHPLISMIRSVGTCKRHLSPLDVMPPLAPCSDTPCK